MKFYNLKDEDELTFTGKQLREWKEIIIREALSNLSPSVRTSPKGDFSNEKEHNISLKTTPTAPSKLPTATSLNNNIHRLRPNPLIHSQDRRNIQNG